MATTFLEPERTLYIYVYGFQNHTARLFFPKMVKVPRFDKTATSTFMYGFRNNIAHLFFLMGQSAIWNFIQIACAYRCVHVSLCLYVGARICPSEFVRSRISILSHNQTKKIYTGPNWKKLQTILKVHLKWKKSAIKGRKHCERRRNCLWQGISPFLTMFSTAIYR